MFQPNRSFFRTSFLAIAIVSSMFFISCNNSGTTTEADSTNTKMAVPDTTVHTADSASVPMAEPPSKVIDTAKALADTIKKRVLRTRPETQNTTPQQQLNQ